MNAFLGALKSRTMWAALATMVLANVPVITDFVTTHISGANAVTILGVVFATLRYFTTSSLADKAAPAK